MILVSSVSCAALFCLLVPPAKSCPATLFCKVQSLIVRLHLLYPIVHLHIQVLAGTNLCMSEAWQTEEHHLESIKYTQKLFTLAVKHEI